MIALWRDINRRLRAEGALRKEATFRAAMENSLVTGLRAREGRTSPQPIVLQYDWCAHRSPGRLPPMPYWAPEVTETSFQERFAQILTGTVQPEAYEKFTTRQWRTFSGANS